MKNDQMIEFQAKIYVFDLNNCAREFGFKADEGWEVGMASSEEKAVIEKQYFPTLSVVVTPDMLAGVCNSVKFKLSQQHARAGNVPDAVISRQQNVKYLVAYSANRLRR